MDQHTTKNDCTTARTHVHTEFPTRAHDAPHAGLSPDDAAAFAERYGVALVPVGPDKAPLVKDWPNVAPLEAVAVRALFARFPRAAGVGLAHRRSQTVDVDVDRHNPAADGMAWLEAHGHECPRTLTVETGGGGRKLIYRLPAPVTLSGNKAHGIAPGVDLVLGQSVIMGRMAAHNGRAYRILDDAPIAPAPDWLLAAMRHTPSHAPDGTPAVDLPPDAAPLEGMAAALAAMRPHTGRNAYLYRCGLAAGHRGAELEAEWPAFWRACQDNGEAAERGEGQCWGAFSRGHGAGVAIAARDGIGPRLAELRALAQPAAMRAALGELGAHGRHLTCAVVLAFLLDYAERVGTLTVHPGVDAIVKATCLSEHTVRRALEALQAAGIIERVPDPAPARGNGGRLQGRSAACFRLLAYVAVRYVGTDNQAAGEAAGMPATRAIDRSGQIDQKGILRVPAPSESDMAVHPSSIGPRLYVRDGDGRPRRIGRKALALERAWRPGENARRQAENANRATVGADPLPMLPPVAVDVRRSPAGWAYCGATGERPNAEALEPDRVAGRGLLSGAVTAYFLAVGSCTAAEAAEAVGCSRRAAYRVLAALEANHLASVDQRPTCGRPENVYHAEAEADETLGLDGPVCRALSETVAGRVNERRTRWAAYLERRQAAPDPTLGEYRAPAHTHRPTAAAELDVARRQRDAKVKALDDELDALAWAMGAVKERVRRMVPGQPVRAGAGA